MLTIIIPDKEFFDEASNQFVKITGQTLVLEHSLVSISKWESKWCKPFLSSNNMSKEELIDYIKSMTITQNVRQEIYSGIDSEIIEEITAYINKPMTATTFTNLNKKPNREIITSEIIYYWMVTFQIPFECQKWHLNRLLTLINVCNIKNQPAKKMGRREIFERNRALNSARRNSLNTRG